MSPYEEVQEVYSQSDEGFSLCDDIEFHAKHGYILSTPTCFLLARAVVKRFLPYGQDETFLSEECDTWFVWAMAGDIREAIEFAPPTMKWIAFARKGVLRFHRFQNVKRKILCLTTK